MALTPKEAESLGDRLELHKTAAAGGPSLTEQKAAACASAATVLEEAGYCVTIRNGGLHLQFKTKLGLIDYWPTTRRFWIAARKQRGYGLNRLAKLLGFAYESK